MYLTIDEAKRALYKIDEKLSWSESSTEALQLIQQKKEICAQVVPMWINGEIVTGSNLD